MHFFFLLNYSKTKVGRLGEGLDEDKSSVCINSLAHEVFHTELNINCYIRNKQTCILLKFLVLKFSTKKEVKFDYIDSCNYISMKIRSLLEANTISINPLNSNIFNEILKERGPFPFSFCLIFMNRQNFKYVSAICVFVCEQ